MSRLTVHSSALLEWLYSYVQNLRKPYIHEGSRESYRAWWELVTKDSWTHYPASFGARMEASPQQQVRSLYPHLFPVKEKRRRRYRSTYRRDWSKADMVSHTTVLPDGTESTYTWPNIHAKHWRRPNEQFREGHAKGVKKEKGRKADSFDRARKTLEFRNNAKTPTRWPYSNGAKRHAQIEDNRTSRREARALLRQGRYDEVKTQMDPTDTWKWD